MPFDLCKGTIWAPVRYASVVLALLAALSEPCVGHDREPGITNVAVEQADSLTDDLFDLTAQFNAASLGERRRLEVSLVAAAAARQTVLTRLLDENPGAVLEAAFPESLRAMLPSAVSAYLEQDADLTGTLGLFHEHWDGGSRYRYYLESDAGRHLLRFAKMPSENFVTGTTVRVQGVRVGDTLALSGDGTSIQQVTAAASSATLGAQRTLVMLVNFADAPIEPYTVAEVERLVFDTVSNFFFENSYHQTWLAGDVVGWLTIPLSSTVCDFNTLAAQAQQAASAAGMRLPDYTHYAYAFPKFACTGLAWATVGGNPSHAWFNGEFDAPAFAHELGHNLGLYHSHARDCGATIDGTNCTTFEYGDPFDAMANSSSGHFNAYQKERLGWLNAGVSPPIQTVTATGTYPISAYETPGSEPKALKLLKSTDPLTGQRTWYYLESRRPLGFDGFIVDNVNVSSGVLLHTGTEVNADSSNLLDLTPSSGILNVQDWSDPALVTGRSFTDVEAGLVITTQSASDTGAVITVSVAGPASAQVAAPTITIATDKSTYARGQTVAITAKAMSGGSPAPNVSIIFNVVKASDAMTTASAITGSNGNAIYKLRLRKQDPAGTYLASAAPAKYPSLSSVTTFTVQ